MDLLTHGMYYCILSLILATGHTALGSSALFTCLFEDDNCGLIQRLDDNLNWTRHTGVGWDTNTGPHAAYQGSYYLYFNTSGTEDKDVAIVETEDLYYSGPACVRFAYIMRGAGMGSLEVHNGTDVVWTRSGSQGENWIEANADVLINSGSGLSLRGQRGPGSLGDIAVDSLAITTGSCFAQVTLPFSCQFEDDTCGMVQGNTGELEWARRSGSTPSEGTGPPGAAQGRWYIYAESTSSQSGTRNGTAIISTPLLNHTGALCVRFKYHMMGANIGVLHAYTSITGRDVIQTIFFQEGQQGPSWQSVEMTVSDFMWQQQITFYTQNAGGYQGDIALDDLWLHPGECHACQLNNGGCQGVCTLTDNGRQCSCPSDLILFNDTHCALKCVPGTFGDECNQECHCVGEEACDVTTGACPMADCADGYTGDTCSEACSPGRFGHGCRQECHCAGGEGCNVTTGACPKAVCADGYTGNTCSEGCADPYEQALESSKAFTSTCPVVEEIIQIDLDQCLRKACEGATVNMVTYRSPVCVLRLCQPGEYQLKPSVGILGWDIYLRNMTPPLEPINEESFPLWPIIVGLMVVVVVLVTMAVVIGIKRRRKSPSMDTAGDHACCESDPYPAPPGGQGGDATYDEIMEITTINRTRDKTLVVSTGEKAAVFYQNRMIPPMDNDLDHYDDTAAAPPGDRGTDDVSS